MATRRLRPFRHLYRWAGRRRRWRWAPTAAVALLATPVAAQLVDTYFQPGIIGYDSSLGITVASRERPDFDPEGIRLGSFVVRPNLSESVGYDSNPAGARPAKGSTAVLTSGSLRANSDWSRNNVGAYVGFDNFTYPTVTQQSYTNWTASLGQVINLGTDKLTIAAAHLNLHQTARDLNTPPLTQPGQYSVNNVRAAYEWNMTPLIVTPALQFTNFNYQNVVDGTGVINQTYRNRNVIDGSVTTKFGYALLRDIAVVLRGASINYTDPQPGQPGRNGSAVAVLAGLDHAADAVWRYRFLVGYQVRTFTNPIYKTESAPIAEANLIFSPTGMTTITATLSRLIQDAAAENVGAYTASGAKITIDHELLRNVLLHAYADIERAVYQGGGTQTSQGFGAGVTWLMNRNMRLAGSYDHINKQSTTLSNSFNENIVLLRLLLGL